MMVGINKTGHHTTVISFEPEFLGRQPAYKLLDAATPMEVGCPRARALEKIDKRVSVPDKPSICAQQPKNILLSPIRLLHIQIN